MLHILRKEGEGMLVKINRVETQETKETGVPIAPEFLKAIIDTFRGIFHMPKG